jgi:hypothetical protein
MTARLAWYRRTVARTLLIGSLLVCGPGLLLSSAPIMHHIFYDFRGGLWTAGLAILHGHSPYQPAFLAHQVSIMDAGGIAKGETSTNSFSIPVYPALANVLVVPLSLLPFWLAGTIYTALSVAAMVAGIWLLGVRDWRCYVLVLLSWPFMYGVLLGAIGPFLALGAGVAWRYRDRVLAPALAIATVVAVKIFPWTLGIWLLITRRWRALAVCVAAGVVITFGAWAVIGFHGLAQYPQMLSNMSLLQENRAVSVVGIMVIAGIPAGVANALAIALGCAILFAAWSTVDGPDGDRRAFGLAILAALTATPIVWDHYMVLLFVPIALASPSLSWAWFIPLTTPIITSLSWIIPASKADVPFSPNTLRDAIPWVVLEALTAFVLCTTPEQRREFAARLVPTRAKRERGFTAAEPV